MPSHPIQTSWVSPLTALAFAAVTAGLVLLLAARSIPTEDAHGG